MADGKLVFIDLDGTLVNKAQQVPESARIACQRMIENGHRLFICSGRSMPEIYPWLWDLGFEGIVSGAGGMLQVGDIVVQDHRIEGAVIEKITQLWKELGALWIWQGPDAMYPSPSFLESFVAQAGESVNDWAQYARTVEPFLRPGLPASTTKCTVYIPAGRTSVDELRLKLPEQMQVISGSIPAGQTLVVEVYPREISKGRGIATIAAYLGYDLADTVAIGDSTNDIEALEVAGIGIAMGSHDPAVLAVADMVAPGIDEDGFATACEMAGLIPTSIA
ncbi:Cof-type HAD-IIB family hydrolase [Schaalia vaccimaxillae]|uniref:Cof-type HAD-IIB family hydrolase n=1 Tax=Schaalia vaccimaxillae TaxID=183916 RepID=UPI0003B61B29|nr:Cof-type HAD-IIB family hydrolase [Schaalia vaccimaxillae]